MARNEEKHYGRLNRLYLLKEKEEYEKKNPNRPRLDTLDTAEEIQKWLPSIKRDIDFYLKKSEVTCYSDAHIDECHEKVIKLEKEYKAFVHKIHKLSPIPVEITPWTSRPYKRKCPETVTENSSKEFKPIATPILDEKKRPCETTFQNMNVNLPLMDEPLTFASKAENSKANLSGLISKNNEMNKSINFSDILKYSITADSLSRTAGKEINYKNNNETKGFVNIVNYDSSDSETNEVL